MRRRIAGATAAAAVALIVLALAPPAQGAASVEMSARVNGVDISKATESHPIKLDPKQAATLELTIRNNGSDAIVVRTVRIDGRVLGLTFFAYDTTINTRVNGHSTENRNYSLDLTGLDGQATGLIPSRVVLLDASRHTIADESGVIDVRGSLKSVYGFFGFAVAVVTGVSIAGTLLALARGRLHRNRLRRGLRFMVPGLGVGLVLVFSLSAFRVLAPLSSRWVPFVVGSAVLFFLIGYLTPTPDTGDDEEEDDEIVLVQAPPPPPPHEIASSDPSYGGPETQEPVSAPEPAPEPLPEPVGAPASVPAPVTLLPPPPELAAPDEHS